MLEIEIDGKKLTVPQGSTIMDAAQSVDTYIPHFCYHKKLSIAANCRMCLVEVEKAPKPLPACATPVTDGMKVFTHSELASKAQKGVMEFLLINHPLDCPICDQGGECQLQDLAVGYGGSSSRYEEEKRSVAPKDMGPLVSAQEMARCIHCTRCVRFTEEIGGVQEIGMANRSEFSEILPFLGKNVESEISGNVIDLCPVGALTSKPFRYSARNWELSRRKSIGAHDGLGSNLIVQVFQNKVMRVLPLENEDINECWLSDRDRFSYEALNSDARLTKPMIKHGGQWHEADWQTALDYVVQALKGVANDHGKDAIGVLAGAQSTTEELFLLNKFASAFGLGNIDHRLRQSDFSADGKQQGALWLGSSIVELAAAKSVLVVGSTQRKEQPLLASRLRQAVKKGSELNLIHVTDDELLTKVNGKLIVAPGALVNALAQVLKAVVELKSGSSDIALGDVTVSAEARKIAESLANAETASIVLGAVAQHSPLFAQLLALAQDISRLTGARFGVLSEAANSVGAQLVGVLPDGGLNAVEMIKQPLKAYVLFNAEAEFDAYNGQAAVAALKQAESVIAFSAFKGDGLLDYADVLLPIAPFTETAGSFVNMEGKLQTFNGVVRPLGETRPAWKVIRVLGNLFELPGFEQNSAEDVRAEFTAQIGELTNKLNNGVTGLAVDTSVRAQALARVGEVPMFHIDAITRRAESLQATSHAAVQVASAHPAELAKAGLEAGGEAVVSQGSAQVRVKVEADASLPEGVLRLAAGHPATAALGGMFDAIELKRG